MTQTRRIALASMAGTTIEFYDFYVFAAAAALVFGPLFFPTGAPESRRLQAFLAFSIAFFARPVGAVLFGHLGDRLGRKSTLVASLLTMGLSTTLIGILPTWRAAGWAAPAALCLLRVGQGIGLGGEWGGAALLATESAPAGRRGWFGMFPQMGPPLGFILANGLFLALGGSLTESQFMAWGWRVPFLASLALVALGLYVRATLHETEPYRHAARTQVKSSARARPPLAELLRGHWRAVLLGSFAIVMSYALFYVCTVFAIGYLAGTRGLPRTRVLGILCLGIVGMAVATPVSGWLADRFGRRPVLAAAAIGTALAGFMLPMGLDAAPGPLLAFLFAALAVMGLGFAPMGALLPELFPTGVRYTGASVAYNLGGILGGSLTPYLAQRLQDSGGLRWVGFYVAAAGGVSLVALCLMRETRDRDLEPVRA